MDYNELEKKYQQLLTENKRLKALIDNYRSYLSLPIQFSQEISEQQAHLSPPEKHSAQSGTSKSTNKFSTTEAKINIFMSLFKGRQDVYAKRWQSTAGKSGYSPVCLNEWDREFCKKPQIKCSACDNKNYAPWNAEAVNSHLRGEKILGVYPLLLDETCTFLAIDFDGDGWGKT